MISDPRAPSNAVARFADWLVAIAVVVIAAGNPITNWKIAPELPLVLLALVLTGLLLVRRRLVPSAVNAVPFAVFAGLIAVHLATVPGAGLFSSAGFVTLLVVAYATMRTTDAAPRLIVVVTTALALLSLVIFSVQHMFWVLGKDLAQALAPLSVVSDERGAINVVIQNFNAEEYRHRNAGVFWEPGALAGYCLFSLLLLGLGARHFSRRGFWICMVVLSVTVLTTFSTTGYLLLPAVLAYHVLLRQPPRLQRGSRSLVVGVVAGVVAVGALTWLYRLDFVGEKIRDQLEISLGETERYWQTTRFGSLISDFTDIAQRPVTGWGSNPLIRPSVIFADEIVQNNQGNGLSGFLSRFGIVGMATFCFFGALGFKRYGAATWTRGVAALVIVLATLFSEQFLNYPLFLSIMFLPALPLLRQRYWVVPKQSAAGWPGIGSA